MSYQDSNVQVYTPSRRLPASQQFWMTEWFFKISRECLDIYNICFVYLFKRQDLSHTFNEVLMMTTCSYLMLSAEVQRMVLVLITLDSDIPVAARDQTVDSQLATQSKTLVFQTSQTSESCESRPAPASSAWMHVWRDEWMNEWHLERSASQGSAVWVQPT